MDAELQWLLFGLPVVFALGWLAARMDLRQWKREQRDSPRAYFKGLNLLLNEQQDKAIDAFVEAVQQDPDSSDLHFALGNLFRRRGEYERAVRMHQHLLARGDLPASERERAQYALAQDFQKAGLFDRAEAAYRELEPTVFATEARLALLGLYERSHEWRSAIDVATRLEQAGTGSFAQRIGHYWCEIAQSLQGKDAAAADAALESARRAAPQAARPRILRAQQLARLGQHREALQIYAEIARTQPDRVSLIAAEIVASAQAAGAIDEARAMLEAVYQSSASLDVLQALNRLDPPAAQARFLAHLRAHPVLSAALAVLPAKTAPSTAGTGPLGDSPAAEAAGPLQAADLAAVRLAVERAAQPLQRYRCAACGFEAQRHFWQCPGCLSWDSYPPLRIEEL